MKHGKHLEKTKTLVPIKDKLHPRSLHRGRYDFKQLTQHSVELAPFVRPNPYGELGIDFADPVAVRIFNKALLSFYYQIKDWDIPAPFLVPPVPGRTDYIHYIADLLAENHQGAIPSGPQIKGLDIGVGANGIYPLVGHRLYGWSFIGSDISDKALLHLQKIIQANDLQQAIVLRKQFSTQQIFNGVYQSPERFHFTMCNPPFHSSPEAAQAGSLRKVRNLNKNKTEKVILNFGGENQELWCPGGERHFITQMIKESSAMPFSCLWYTTLVSKKENVGPLQQELRKMEVQVTKVISMGQGQKNSRILAWSFMNDKQRQDFMQNEG
ncbi:23S rRNA (adenine(1618)-N(6))-methyltransferase RlmF [Dyadobacter tibetensis]|uniref:23S rRNA (adenine(1618)-N(6))-methyltransferase RlmF n=1 Tax=Dyadobacter tibetensis TaxID=1211851 RepID=UPI000470A120|nr:23S rRNA (adenine(1618)-N(6))-methyltransferase RlmF [Dyadobacter tibetensis]